MEDAMDVVQVARKGNFMNVLETFDICKETHLNNILNDKSTLGYNKIFEFLIHYEYTRYTAGLPYTFSRFYINA